MRARALTPAICTRRSRAGRQAGRAAAAGAGSFGATGGAAWAGPGDPVLSCAADAAAGEGFGGSAAPVGLAPGVWLMVPPLGLAARGCARLWKRGRRARR